MRLYKQWHRPISKQSIKPPYSISRATSIDSECCRLPTTSVLSKKTKNYVPTSSDQQVQIPQGHTSYRNKTKWNTEVHGGGGLELVKPARKPASSRPKPCASLKKPHDCPFAAPCGSRRKKKNRGQTSGFPSETSRLAPLILAHRGSALTWLIDDRAALCLRRIWCVPTRYSATRLSATVLFASRVPPHLPKGIKLELGRGAHLGTTSSANHTAAASQPTG